LTGSDDKTIRVWDLEFNDCVRCASPPRIRTALVFHHVPPCAGSGPDPAALDPGSRSPAAWHVTPTTSRTRATQAHCRQLTAGGGGGWQGLDRARALHYVALVRKGSPVFCCHGQDHSHLGLGHPSSLDPRPSILELRLWMGCIRKGRSARRRQRSRCLEPTLESTLEPTLESTLESTVHPRTSTLDSRKTP